MTDKGRLAILNLADPASIVIPPGTTGVYLTCKGAEDIDRAAVEAAIMPQESRKEVKSVCWGCDQLRSCWPVSLFPGTVGVGLGDKSIVSLEELVDLPHLSSLRLNVNPGKSVVVIPRLKLTYLWTHIRKPLDEESVGKCVSLEWLEACRWQSETLEKLSPLSLQHVTFRGGGPREIVGLKGENLNKLGFFACQGIRKFGELRSQSVFINMCRNVELDTLSNVQGMKTLGLVTMKILDLGFVRGCRELKTLILGGCKILTKDFRAIEESDSLREVWLSSVKKATIAEVSRRNPRIAVCNGDVRFRDGVDVGFADYGGPSGL
jgi:hypothetical protein